MSDGDMNMPAVGDRVRVVVPPHMPGHTEGVVRQVLGMALGIEFDSMPGRVHQWYVPSEVMVTGGGAGKMAGGGGKTGGGAGKMALKPGVPDFARHALANGGTVSFDGVDLGAVLAAVNPPPQARMSDYWGCWAYEPDRFLSQWNVVRGLDLAGHFAAPPATRAPTLLTEPGVGGHSIARVVMRGTLMKGQSSFGGTSTVQLRRDIRQAAADPNVSGILLDIDSPGGTVAGTADLAAEVKAARKRKPVWAHVDDLGASAAYWVASQADQIFANDRTALVGSIGTLMTVYDLSAQAEKEGVKALVFATGPMKGAGAPGAEVSEGQRAYFQKLVDDSQASFDAAVRAGRGMTAAQLAAARTGGVFPAAEALDLKLIDGIRSLDRTLEALARAK